MIGNFYHLIDVAGLLIKEFNVYAPQLLLQNFLNISRSNLYASCCRNHSFISEALSHLLHPIIQPRDQSIIDFKCGKQCFLKFQIELHKLQQPNLKLLMGDLEEVEDSFDYFLEKGVIIDCELPVDICGALRLHHSYYLLSISIANILTSESPTLSFRQIVLPDFVQTFEF